MSSNSKIVDALAYATFQNIIPVSELPAYGLSSLTTQAPDQTNVVGFLNGFLNQTQLKRACCIYGGASGNSQSESYNVMVRIPVPENPGTYNYSNSIFGPQWQKFQYIDKSVSIPASVCATLTDSNGPYQSGTANCDNFMNIYCNNAKIDYTNEISALGTLFDNDEFALYKPECACYGTKPSYITGNPSPLCYLGSCNPTSGVYLSPAARIPCSATFCTSNINFNGNQAGGGISISSKVEQNCGQLNGGGGSPGSPSNPASPGSPSNPANPASPGSPSNPANPASPGSPSNPASPGSTPSNPKVPSTPSPSSEQQNTGIIACIICAIVIILIVLLLIFI